MPDPRLQEKACAVISMKPGKTPLTFKTCKNYLKQKGVAKQYWPEHLEVVEEYPRTPVEKFKSSVERKDS